MTEYKKWGEMSRDEQINLAVALHVDGLDVETSDDCKDWIEKVKHAKFEPNKYYRIKPTKPSIDWSHVHPDYKWMATEAHNETYLFYYKPRIEGHFWCDKNDGVYCEGFASFKPGTCHWTESLVERPNDE